MEQWVIWFVGSLSSIDRSVGRLRRLCTGTARSFDCRLYLASPRDGNYMLEKKKMSDEQMRLFIDTRLVSTLTTSIDMCVCVCECDKPISYKMVFICLARG